jgi:hypothetical protein
MKTTRWTAGLALALGSILQGCDDASNPAELAPVSRTAASLAGAGTFTSNERIPIDLPVFIPCANGGSGEDVQLSGNLHVLVHTAVNGNHFTTKLHFQPQGITGAGDVTGDKYQATGVTQERFGGSFINGQFSDTFINNFRIIGQGPGNNFLVHETFHITINANGEVTASVDNFTISCT